MFISELFYSIQGEGLLLGTPSVFIRTSGCNLRCHWCDTPYTSWNPSGSEMTVEEIVKYTVAHSTGYVVVTGGEPMIAPQIVALTEALRGAGQHITIETAGTVFAPVACDLMSISPKLANSTPVSDAQWGERHERLRIQPDVLRQLVTAYEHQLKFVVVAESDLVEIRELVAMTGADRSRVVLMPEGRDWETLRSRGEWLAEICKREGYRLSPRLHVELWGDRRGV